MSQYLNIQKSTIAAKNLRFSFIRLELTISMENKKLMYKIVNKKGKRHRWWLAETASYCTTLTSGKKTFITLLLQFIFIYVVNNIHIKKIHAIFTRDFEYAGYTPVIIIIIAFVEEKKCNGTLVVHIFLCVMSCQSTYISRVKISQYPNAFLGLNNTRNCAILFAQYFLHYLFLAKAR